jgi:hypothetical protein
MNTDNDFYVEVANVVMEHAKEDPSTKTSNLRSDKLLLGKPIFRTSSLQE